MATLYCNDFNELPLSTVLQLYEQKLKVEVRNDIKGRTRLLRQYPELYDEMIWHDVVETCEMVRAVERKRLIERKMGILLL